MKRPSYLNVILTVIAVLLAGTVWVQVADRPLLAATAHAHQDDPAGIPNAGKQREEMIEALRGIKSEVDDLAKAVREGTMRVEVSNIAELKESDSDNDGG